MLYIQDKDHQIEFHNVSEGDNLLELKTGGGKTQVPCLRIEEFRTEELSSDNNNQGVVTWLYESDDILSYIKSNSLISSGPSQ